MQTQVVIGRNCTTKARGGVHKNGALVDKVSPKETWLIILILL